MCTVKKRKPLHHPPEPGLVAPPQHLEPGYIEGNEAVAGFGTKDFYIMKIPVATAREIIVKNHYSGRIVNNSYVHVGVFLEGNLVGALQLGYALNPRRVGHIVANTEVGEYLELNRMWLSDIAPKNSESRAISYVTKYLRKACPMVKWIRSYADERCGRLGVVYQACNFLYLGSHKTAFYELDGETYHTICKTAHLKGGGRGRYLRANIERAEKKELRQFRYLFFVKKKFRKDLVMVPQAYPKPVAA